MDKYRIEIREALKNLSTEKLILFAMLCCERLYPNYFLFSEETGWGDNTVLIEGIDKIVEFLQSNELNENQIKQIQNKIDSITPSTEDFSTILVSFALDACTSVYETLDFLLDPNIDKIVDVAIFARDTVDMFIQEKEMMDYTEPEFEIKIENDPFMKNEKARQVEHINKLVHNEITPDLIEKMRRQNLQNKIIDYSMIINRNRT